MASSSFRSRTTGRNGSQRRGELAAAAVPVAGSLHRDLDTRNEVRYYWKVIRSFKDKRVEAIFRGEFVKGLDGKIQQRAREKLKYLDSAATLGDLAVPPGNQLEALKGDRKGQHSIRVNQQWRVCFVWKDGDVTDAEIVDYH
jgi:proteic killer suppression protein